MQPDSATQFRFARRTAQISVNYAADLLREAVMKMQEFARKTRRERAAEIENGRVAG